MRRLLYAAVIFHVLFGCPATEESILEAIQKHYNSNCVILAYTTRPAFREWQVWHRLSILGVPTMVLHLTTIVPESLSGRCPNSRPLVVLLNREMQTGRLLEQLSKKRSLSGPRWLVFLPHTTPQDFLRDVSIPFNCELLVAGPPALDGEVKLTEAYRTQQDLPLITELWGIWTPSEGLLAPTLHLYQRRSNLRGATLRVVVKEFLPLLSVWTSEDGKTMYPTGGYFGMVWEALQHNLNCSTQYISPPDGQWGRLQGNGSWTGILGTIQRGEADVALSGYSIIAHRAEAVDYSQPLMHSKVHVFVQPVGAMVGGWKSFLAPLQSILWLTVLGVIPVAAFGLQILYNVEHWYSDSEKRISFTESIHLVFSTFCLQGIHLNARLQPCVMFHWALYMTAIVVYTAYSCFLVAFLSAQRESLPFTTFEEMLQDGSYRLEVLAESSQFITLEGSKLPPFSTIFQKMIAPSINNLPREMADSLHRLCTWSRYAFFASEDIMMPYLTHPPCRLLKVPRTAFSTITGLLYPKGSPYRPIIARKLEDLRRRGVLDILTRRTWQSTENSPTKNTQAVTLDTSCSLFVLLMIGTSLAIVALIIEVWSSSNFRCACRIGSKSAAEATVFWRRCFHPNCPSRSRSRMGISSRSYMARETLHGRL